MSVQIREYLTVKYLKSKIKEHEDCDYGLITIIEFVMSPFIGMLMSILEEEFNSKAGRPAFPRVMLLIILLYAFYRRIGNMSQISYFSKHDDLVKIVTDGKGPSYTTLKRFLNSIPTKITKLIFVYTLVRLNDDHYLNFTKSFLDSTDGLVQGSKFYKIRRKEIKAFRYMKKWGLIHRKNSKATIERIEKALKMKKVEFKDNDEILEIIKIIEKRPELYTTRIYKKINEFERLMDKHNKNYVSIMVPDSTMGKTKKNMSDFIMTIQSLTSENGILLSALVLDQPNDKKALKHILWDLYETGLYFKLVQATFGKRNNTDAFLNRIEHMLLICDSGYFTRDNLFVIEEFNVNALIMPNDKSREINKLITEMNLIFEENPEANKKFIEKEKETREYLKRTINGFLCEKHGGEIRFQYKKISNNEYNKEHPDNPDSCKDYNYHFFCNNENCCERETCPNKHIVETQTPLMYSMRVKFAQKRYRRIYKDRHTRGEWFNSYAKGTKTVFHFISPTPQGMQNQINLIATLANTTRHINIKDSIT